MLKRKRLIMIFSATLLTALILASVGMTAAIWTSEGEGNTYTPEAPAYDWNFWQKYMLYENVYDGDSNVTGVTVTGFSDVVYKEIIIPKELPVDIGGDAVMKPVLNIKSTLFYNSSLKNIPEKIVIPPTVILIQSMAFSSLPNLTEVIFVNADGAEACEAQLLSFGFCPNLKTVKLQGRRVSLPPERGAFTGSDNAVVIE